MSDLFSLSNGGDGAALRFDLRPRSAPKASIAMTNTSSSSIVFKVRTTQPMWYYVRPNQDMLAAGQTVELIFTLTESECDRFLELYRAGNAESVDKHRFLVQAKSIEASDRDLILGLPADSQNRNAEVSHSFASPTVCIYHSSPIAHSIQIIVYPHLGDRQ
jgi:hypothetical protein